jgi:hypothetical protein
MSMPAGCRQASEKIGLATCSASAGRNLLVVALDLHGKGGDLQE